MLNTQIKISTRLKKSAKKILKKKERSKIEWLLRGFVGISLYTLAFFTAYYIKRQTLIIDHEYYQVYVIIIISVIIGAILSNKISLNKHHDFSQIFKKNYISLIFSLGALSVLFIIFSIDFTSRFLLLGTFVIGSLLETIYHVLISEERKKVSLVEKSKLSLNYFVIDGLILTIVNLIKIALPFSQTFLDKKHFAALAICYISWIFSGVITHKFNPIENSQNKWHAFGLQIKFYLLNMSLIAIAIYVLQISDRFVVFFAENILTYTGISFLYFIYTFAERISNKTDEAIVTFLNSYELKTPEESTFAKLNGNKYQVNSNTANESNLRQILQSDYLRDYPKVFAFIDRKIDLMCIDAKKSKVLRSIDNYNIKILPENSHEFIMNLHEINDFRKINDYLRLVNSKLINGGIIVGCLIHNKKRHQRLVKKYNFILGNVLYFFHFIVKRVIPKLPLIRNFFYKLTNGKNRPLSLTEGLGRLVYCGFEILDIIEINDLLFFACKKNKNPNNINHSYSTIFKMRRVGKNGKEIYVYKLRTMHPYAEFLQEFVYQNNKLEVGGKIKNDFRIPAWGKIFRQLWIDEIPMIINWLKGDLKLVGVRPLSQQYLNLYTEEHKNFRLQFKPGLVPPFYADMPKTIEEIEESEARYLRAYMQNPIKTDLRYFFKILNNIIFKKKRSA